MRFAQVKVGSMDNFAYVLGDEATGEGAIVDPGFEPARLVAEAGRLGVKVTHVLVTHAHFDHVRAVPEVVKATGAKVAAHRASPLRPDVPLDDGVVLRIGHVDVRVHATPGHQPDHLCYEAGGRLLTGDTLFVGECGRTDLPGSDPRAMWRSLQEVLARLPRSLEVCPGHDYGPTPTSTLDREFRDNYTLRPRTIEEFLRFMQKP